MIGFTGLIPDTPEQLAERKSLEKPLPAVCFSTENETRLSRIPSWVKFDDQRQMNSCAGHGGTTALEKIAYNLIGRPQQLSRLFLYAEGQKRCGIRGDNGCALYGIVKAAMEVGVAREEVQPYGPYQTKFSEAVYQDAANWRLKKTLKLDLGYNSYRAILGQNIGSILVGTMWPIEIQNGYVRSYRRHGGGGHAYAAMFLADTADANGRPDVWFVNSHQGNFAFKGSATFVEEMQGEDHFGNVGFTDMDVPAPRKIDYFAEGNFPYE